VSTEVLALGRWLAEHPAYRAALAVSSEDQSDVGEAAATVYADFIDQVLSKRHFLPAGYMDAWNPYFEDRLVMYPQIRRFVDAHPGWYGKTLNDLVREATARAAQSPTRPTAGPS
jgi:hypothetical protein